MSARSVRAVVIVVCALGIAGMIVTSITDHNGAAITFGLITAAAILCSMVATAVAAGGPARPTAATAPTAPVEAVEPESLGAAIEAKIAALVAAGASEDEVRALVGEAVRFGQSRAATERTT